MNIRKLFFHFRMKVLLVAAVFTLLLAGFSPALETVYQGNDPSQIPRNGKILLEVRRLPGNYRYTGDKRAGKLNYSIIGRLDYI